MKTDHRSLFHSIRTEEELIDGAIATELLALSGPDALGVEMSVEASRSSDYLDIAKDQDLVRFSLADLDWLISALALIKQSFHPEEKTS